MHVPLFAVFGGLLTATAWVVVMTLHTDVLIAGSAWMVLGLVTYFVYRRSQGLSLTETVKIQGPPPIGVGPVSYGTVMVAFEENTFSETALATAFKLASHRRADVRVLITLVVPNHLDLQADLGEAEGVAGRIIEAARQQAGRGQHVRGTVVKVRSGEAGHRIVAEAIDSLAEAIVMPMPSSRPPGKLLNRALEVVLSKRPCRVVIDSQPARPFERTAPRRRAIAVEAESAPALQG
jgi:APA family basic amino acid/polyamine antiporter